MANITHTKTTRKITKGFWIKLVSAPILMFFFAYALVPIYDVLCEITGFNGTTGRLSNEIQYSIDENHQVEVSFFASTAPGFAVDFAPKVASMMVVPGKFYSSSYIAKNNTDQTIIGQAIPSVAPTEAAAHFKKLECFCFNKQVFKPNEEIELPLRFVVQPGLDKRIQDISLSYNFFTLNS